MRRAEIFRTSQNICLATTAAWDRFPTQQFSWLAREATKRYADIEFYAEWLAFVPAPRTLSPEAETTTESNIQSVDKPILRVSHAMLCQGGPQTLR